MLRSVPVGIGGFEAAVFSLSSSFDEFVAGVAALPGVQETGPMHRKSSNHARTITPSAK